jgi:hypothetical protein
MIELVRILRLLEVFIFTQRKGVGMGSVKNLKSLTVAAPVTALSYLQKWFAMMDCPACHFD